MIFRKKPIEIEAVQFYGTKDSADLIADHLGIEHDAWWYSVDVMVLNTLEGNMLARKGDWVVKGIQGEFYPIKEDIFNDTYDAV